MPSIRDIIAQVSQDELNNKHAITSSSEMDTLRSAVVYNTTYISDKLSGKDYIVCDFSIHGSIVARGSKSYTFQTQEDYETTGTL